MIVVFLVQCRVAAEGAQAQRRLAETDSGFAIVDGGAGTYLLFLLDKLLLEIPQPRAGGRCQIAQCHRRPLAGQFHIRARPEQIENTHVPQLGFAQTVGRQLPIGHVAAVDKVFDVMEIHRFLIAHRVTRRDAVRVDRGAQKVIRVRHFHQWANVPVSRCVACFFTARVEDEPEPAFGIGEALFQIQPMGDHERQMQKQLPEVKAVGAFEVHQVSDGVIINGRFL